MIGIFCALILRAISLRDHLQYASPNYAVVFQQIIAIGNLPLECSSINVTCPNLILAPCLIYWLIWMPIRTGGYVPSTSASDDYLDALKSDSKQKTKTLHAKLSGRPVPPESQQPAPTAPGVADAGPYEVRTS